MEDRVFARRVFSRDDTLLFAAASGDHNPIHVDAVAARRLVAGESVVHGMHLVLWALDELVGRMGAPRAIRAKFPKPVLVGDEVELVSTPSGAGDNPLRLAVRRGQDTLAIVEVSGTGARVERAPEPGRPPERVPIDHSFEQLANANGETPVFAMSGDLAALFPRATDVLGPLPVAAIMTLSRIVGTECPGLHSIFAAIDLHLDADESARLRWNVRQSVPSALLRMSVHGGGLTGTFDAFVRPRPVAQPSMGSVKSVVGATEFEGQRALVVGGSRGLGELTAKVVAAGGGDVTLTYATGASDAARVCAEIADGGGRAVAVELDVEDPRGLSRLTNRPTHVYYFAAPRIEQRRVGAFDSRVHALFSRVFVDAFANIVLALGGAPSLSVFYPSTVFIDELPREFPEYVAAKAAAEVTCDHLARHNRGLTIYVRRLPRLPTDQTASIIRRETADPLTEVVRIVRETSREGPGRSEV